MKLTEKELDDKWQKIIKYAEIIDYYAQQTDRYVTHMTDALVLTARAMYTNAVNEDFTNWNRDKSDILYLFNNLGNYQVHRDGHPTRVNLTKEYGYIDDLLKEVL